MPDDLAFAGTEVRHLPGHLDGCPFTALLQDDDQQREAALSRLLHELARPDVRVVRMGNSMRSRLMLEHILIQVAGTDGRVSQDEAARRIARTIAERQGRETRVVLLITQAETLHSKTLRLLQAMQPHLAEAGAPTLQVVFVGREAFRDLLDGRGMTLLRDALGLQPQAEAVPPAPDGAPAPELDFDPRPLPIAEEAGEPAMLADPPGGFGALHGEADHPGPAPRRPPRPSAAGSAAGLAAAARRKRRRSLVLGLAVFAAMALAAYMGLHAAFHRKVSARAVPSLLHPAGPVPAAVPPVPGPAAQDPQASSPPSGPAAPARALPSDPGRSRAAPPAAARRDPDAPDPSGPPPRESAPPPALPPPAAPPSRVVIHVPTGSDAAESMSAHLRAGLGLRMGTVEARRVADAPSRPSIRFFHPGDEAVARQVVAWMVDAGLSWTLQDFSAFSPRPSRGTIEIWLPKS